MSSHDELIPFTQPDRMVAAGIPFETEHSARWAYRRRHENGLAEAFVRIGRRIYVDRQRFHEVVRRGRST